MALKFSVYLRFLKFLKKNPLFWGNSNLQELYQNKATVHDKSLFTEHSLSIQILLVSYYRFGILVSEGSCSLQNFSILTAYENLGDM